MTDQLTDQPRSPEEAPARPAKLAHVVLRTKQFQPMVDWYKTVLGAHSSFDVPGVLAFLTYDDEHHRIAIAALPGLGDRPAMVTGLEHIAFTYAELGELVHTYQRLKELGITPYWTINHGPTLSFYYRDPDDNQVELQVDNFATTEEINEFLRTEYPTNPIGVEFDPDQLARDYHAGVPESALRKRPDIGPRGLDGAPSL